MGWVIDKEKGTFTNEELTKKIWAAAILPKKGEKLMAKKGITPMKPPKSPMASGKAQNPNVSNTKGHGTAPLGKPKAKSSGSGSNKAGGGRDSGAAKAL